MIYTNYFPLINDTVSKKFYSKLDYAIDSNNCRLTHIRDVVGEKDIIFHNSAISYEWFPKLNINICSNDKYHEDNNLGDQFIQIRNLHIYDDFFAEYFSIEDHNIPKYYNPFIGTHSEMSNALPLSDFDPVCKLLDKFGTYLLNGASNIVVQRTEMDRQKRQEQYFDSENYIPTKKDKFKSRDVKILTQNSDYYLGTYLRENNGASKFPNFLNIDRSESRQETENRMSKLLFDTNESLNLLRTIIDGRQHVGILKPIDSREIYKLNRWIGDIKANQIEIKKSMHRYIDFRMLLKSSTVINFDCDTGYVDENGDYKHISLNKIDLKDTKDVSGIISNYRELSHHREDMNSDLYYIFQSLHETIEMANFSNEQRNILHWFLIEDLPISSVFNEPKCKTIIEKLGEMGARWDTPRISRFLNKTAPKMIADAYRKSYEDYVYTYKIKGSYSKCTACGEGKLKKYFGKDSRNKNGTKSVCKSCDKSKK